MSNICLIILFTLLNVSVKAQVLDKDNLLNREEKNSTLRRRLEPRLSNKYYRGRYLVYDCIDRHYVCVNLPSFYNCRETRVKEIENKEVLLSCAPLKLFKTQKECFDANYKLIHRVTNKAFCVNRIF
ncbi:hypothetical protein A9Q84_11695 [Halobacteriovorax marinus]|uniref:Uncharacterized protein n=1 Tax=Halobacteriovorax marinus TaxID=97084 RepID=A0A1Y5FEH6_9BACT|nr:hypothetical protein A9Q84_11695 [Halobacteriovorax marinus]